MGKGIYALIVCFFLNQFRLIPREANNMENLALFVSLVCVKYWNETAIGIRTPYNDIEHLSLLKIYPDVTIGKKLTLLLPDTSVFI